MSRQLRAQLAHMREMLQDAFTVGVTGTKGKTSTTEFIAQLLEAQGLLTAVSTGVSSRIGTRYVEPCTDFGEVHDFVRRAHRAEPDAFVIELTSEALAGGLNHGLDCDVAVLTNIGTDHIPTHGSLAGYLAAKQRIFRDLAVTPRTPAPTAVLNADDPHAEAFARTLRPGVRVVTYGLTTRRLRRVTVERHITASAIHHRPSGTSFIVDGLSAGPVTVHTALHGTFNVMNVLAALGACVARVPDVRGIQAALRALRPPPGRFDIVSPATRTGPGIVVDYAHTPESIEEALTAARLLTRRGRQLHVVFGCGGNTWRRKRPLMGAAAARHADRITITADNARTESPQRIADDILRGIPRRERARVIVELDRRHAIHAAISDADAGDVVAVLGRGEERTLTLAGRHLALSDAREARIALDRRAPEDVSERRRSLSATAAVVIDARTGAIVFGRHERSPRPPASLVKLMTLLVAHEAIRAGHVSPSDPVQISAYAAQTPHPRIACRAAATVPLRTLLDAVAIRSSNLAATAVAEHIAGSERAFVAAMNRRARGLGLLDTRFATPHGLPHRHQQASALDLSLLLAHLIRSHAVARRSLGGSTVSINGKEYRRSIPLLEERAGVLAMKTGFTWEAGYNVAAAWRIGRSTRIAVVLGAATRAASFKDVRTLMTL